MRGGHEASLRELLARLIDSAKAFAQAEVALVKKTAAAWAGAAAIGAGLVLIASILVIAAVIILIAALGMTLAIWVGTPAGLAIAAILALVLAGLLGWLAYRRFVGMVK